MWNWTAKVHPQCYGVRDALERTSATDPAGGATSRIDVRAQLSEAHRAHLNVCESCGAFTDELLETRRLLRSEVPEPQPSPFFAARVMATIADREAQLRERETQTWAAVPRLAYRLAAVASLALLIAGGWLFQRPAQKASVTLTAADQHAESLVDGGTPAQDDLLVNLAER